MSAHNGPRPVKVVLGEALDEIRARGERLEPFVGELQEVRAVIKALEKLVGADTHPKPTSSNPSGDTKRAILAALGDSMTRLSMEEIAAKIGREPAGWLAMQCKRLVGAGQLDEVDGRYGLTSPIGAEDAA